MLWYARLTDAASPNKADLLTEAGRLLDENISPVQLQVNKPFIIALAYPSSTYSATGCIPSGSGNCFDWMALNRPNADLATVNLDTQQQVDIYDASVWKLYLDPTPEKDKMWMSQGSSYLWEQAGTVTVPAGTFSDCWSARQVGVEGESYTTYCRGVGPVRIYLAGGIVGSGFDAVLTMTSF